MSKIGLVSAAVLITALPSAACGSVASTESEPSTPTVTRNVGTQAALPTPEQEPSPTSATAVNDPTLSASLRSSICGGVEEPCPPSWVEPKVVAQVGGELRIYLPVSGKESGDWMCRNARVWARDELADVTAVVVYAKDGTVVDEGTIDGGC